MTKKIQLSLKVDVHLFFFIREMKFKNTVKKQTTVRSQISVLLMVWRNKYFHMFFVELYLGTIMERRKIK